MNQTFASKYLDRQSPLGQRMHIAELLEFGDKVEDPWFEVIGVVGDLKNQGLQDAPLPEVWVPYTVTGLGRAGHPGAHRSRTRCASERRAQGDLGHRPQRGCHPHGLARRIHREFSHAGPRFGFLMMSLFAGIGLVLVTIGVYSVIAYTDARQTHEIGIRMALGARPGDVLAMIVKMGARLVVLGVADRRRRQPRPRARDHQPALGRLADDPATLVSVVAVLLLGTGLVACWIPARRATRVDPARRPPLRVGAKDASRTDSNRWIVRHRTFLLPSRHDQATARRACPLRRLRRGRGGPARRPSLRAEPRRQLDGPLRGSLRGLLSRTPAAAGSGSNPIPPDQAALERVRQALRGQPALPVGHARRRRPPGAHPGRAARAEDRRLLRRLHGRGGGGEARGVAARSRTSRASTALQVGYGAGPRCSAQLHLDDRLLGHACSASGSDQDFEGLHAGSSPIVDRGRPRPARPRLLPEGRRALAGDPREVPRARARDVRPARRPRGRGGRATRDGDGDRDRARPRLAHPRRAARSPQDLPPHRPRRRSRRSRPPSAGTTTSSASGWRELDRPSTSPSRSSSQAWTRASTPRRSRRGRRTCAGTSRAPPRPTCPRPSSRPTSTSTEDVCAGSPQMRPRWKRCVSLRGPRARRGARARSSCSRIFPPETKRGRPAHGAAGREGHGGATSSELPWMSAATKAKALEKLAHDAQQDRLSRQVARLRGARGRPRATSSATCARAASVRDPPRSSPRSASPWTAASGA